MTKKEVVPVSILEVPKTASDIRDTALVLAPVIYLLGFITWALHAQRNSLGLLPGVDSQYFAAGLIPAVVLAVAVYIVVLTRRFARWSASEPSSRRYRIGAAMT